MNTSSNNKKERKSGRETQEREEKRIMQRNSRLTERDRQMWSKTESERELESSQNLQPGVSFHTLNFS